MLHPGDLIAVRVLFVADYAVWGRTDGGPVGFIPLDLDEEGALPALGDLLRVRVERLLDPVGQEQHSDLTFDGRIRKVEFLATLAE